MSDEYLTVKQLMEMYSVSDATVRRWMKAGLPCLKFGQQVLRFKKDAATEWIKEHYGFDDSKMESWAKFH